MLKVGFFGIEGVGKTSVSTVLSFIMAYLMEEEGKIAAVMDADLEKADLTNLLLGKEGFNGLHDVLLGNKLPEEVVYDPLISLDDSSIRRRLSDLIKLKVIPAGNDDASMLMFEPIDFLLMRLKSLEQYLQEIGVGLLLVDLPSSDYSVRVLLKAISKWVDFLIPILIPNKSSILQTKRHLLSLDINPPPIPFVIVNKCKRDLQLAKLRESVISYWNAPTYLLPFDAEFSQFFQSYSISLPKIHESALCSSLVEGFEGSIGNEERSVVKHLNEIFQRNYLLLGISNSRVFIGSDVIGHKSLSTQPCLLRKDQPPMRLVEGITQTKRGPIPRDIYEELESSSIRRSLLPFFRRKFKIRYSDGREVTISRRNLREALLLAGLDERLVGSLTAGQELDLSSISQEHKKSIDLALAFLRLRKAGGI